MKTEQQWGVQKLCIFNVYFQDRKHVIFYILLRGKFFSTFLPSGGSNLPNGVGWERYFLTFFDDLEGHLMFFVLFWKIKSILCGYLLDRHGALSLKMLLFMTDKTNFCSWEWRNLLKIWYQEFSIYSSKMMQFSHVNELRGIARTHTRHPLFRHVIIIRAKVFMRSVSHALDAGYVLGNSAIFNMV